MTKNELVGISSGWSGSTLSSGDHIWYINTKSSNFDYNRDASKLVILIAQEEQSSVGEAARVVTIFAGTTSSTKTASARSGMSAAGIGDHSTTIAIESATTAFQHPLHAIGPLESARFTDDEGYIYVGIDAATNSSLMDYQIGAILLP